MGGMVSFKYMNADDAEFVLQIRNDPTTVKQLHDSRVFTVEQFTEWFILTKPNWHIILNDGVPCGYVRRKDIDNGHGLQIGIDIHPDFRQKGIATKTYQTIFNYNNQADSVKMKAYSFFQLEVLDTNTVAIKLYEKLGFKEINRYEFDNGYNSKFSIVMERDSV